MAEHPLVNEVARAMFAVTDTGKTIDLADAPQIAQARYAEFAKAAIRAQADWLAQNGHADAAALLREVEG